MPLDPQSNEIATLRQADHEVHRQFLERWSPRSYLSHPVPDELLFSVLEAARWAPSANNQQSWRYIVARTPEQLQAFHTFINPSNLEWCAKAPVLILLLSKTTNDKGDPFRWHAFDTGTAWGYLALQALHAGLAAHAMAGFKAELARSTLHIPEEYEMHAVVALGYQGPPESLPPHRQALEKPNGRRAVADSIVDFTP